MTRLTLAGLLAALLLSACDSVAATKQPYRRAVCRSYKDAAPYVTNYQCFRDSMFIPADSGYSLGQLEVLFGIYAECPEEVVVSLVRNDTAHVVIDAPFTDDPFNGVWYRSYYLHGMSADGFWVEWLFESPGPGDGYWVDGYEVVVEYLPTKGN